MNRPQFIRLSIAFLAALSAATTTAPSMAQARSAPPDITGHWVSSAPEPMGSFYGTRDFHFVKDRWRIVFKAYADKDGKQPLFTLENAGAFAVGGPSAKVDGAWEAIFPQTQRLLIADSDAGAALFAQMGCQIAKAQPRSMTQERCGFVLPLMQAMGEYDLVAVKDSKLFFGDRSGDLTVTRPEKLTPFGLSKK